MTNIAMAEKHDYSKKSRIFYIDNIRIYLTALVLLHHIAVGYGGSGGWAIYENDFNTVDDLTKIVLPCLTPSTNHIS